MRVGHRGGLPRADVARRPLRRSRASVAALSRSTPPSAHSMRQSPGAMSGSASTTRRPSKPRARAISSSCVARGLVQRVVDAHHDMRRRDQLPEAFGGERRDLGERLARDQAPARACARPRPRPRPPRSRAALRPPRGRAPARSSASPICSSATAVRRAATAVPSFSAAAKPLRKPLLSASRELDRVLRRRDRLLGRSAPAAKSWSNRNLALRAAILSRSALRRASWRS